MLGPVVVVAVVLLHQQTVAALNLVNNTAGQQPPSNVQTMLTGGHGTDVVDDVIDLITSSCIFSEDYLFLRRLAYQESRDGLEGNTPGYNGGLWKVDRTMFQTTQSNTPLLQAKYAAIRREFGIDWMSVRWEDLQKPLYSGLAAALYLVVQGQVPADKELQGNYVQQHYDPHQTANNFTRKADEILMCTAEERQIIDVVFLLDATTPALDFTRIHDFVIEVVRGLAGDIRIAVYQFGGGSYIQKNFALNAYTLDQFQTLTISITQFGGFPNTAPDIGSQLILVMTDAWAGVSQRPLAAKMVVLITDRVASSDSSLTTASQTAASLGISVLTLGVGHQVRDSQLDRVATYPKCRHHLSVSSFQDIKFFSQLVTRTICREPVIARGMFHCRIDECRNVAFPITNPTTTVITNVTCDDGRVYVTTRMPRPNANFNDFTSVVESVTGPKYVTVADDVGHFIYADFFPIGTSDPSCIVTMTTVNGIIDSGPKACEEWLYPAVNPCLTATRQLEKFPYDRDHSMFIQCDLQNQMYLTKCPPGYPFYSADCEVCLGGPNSPAIAGCKSTTQVVDTPFCGLASNPCTQENILQDHLYFACPVDETMYLQCNIWGHAFVRSCPEHEVWRQHDIACVYHNTEYNPCGSIPGERYYPYPPDPHFFVDCGDNNVPNVKPCLSNLVWNQVAHTCDYQHGGTTLRPATYLTEIITFGVRTTPNTVTYHPVSGLLTNGYAPPCTLDNVQSNQLFHPYPGHPTQYMQCDLWGDTYVKDCQSGYSYDPYSHTCVDGPVHVDGSITG